MAFDDILTNIWIVQLGKASRKGPDSILQDQCTMLIHFLPHRQSESSSSDVDLTNLLICSAKAAYSYIVWGFNETSELLQSLSELL